MDTVWIRLTVVKDNGTKQLEHFMFGPTGIVKFCTISAPNKKDVTRLHVSSGAVDAQVEESSDFIMDIIRKIRNTKGALDGAEEQGEESQSETSSSEAQSETEANN